MPNSDARAEIAKERILADLTPVAPLATPWRRALVALPIAAIVVAGVWGLSGLRPDLQSVGFAGTWGASALFTLAGYGLFVLLAREVIPGSAVPVGISFAAVIATIEAQIGATALIDGHSPYPVPAGEHLAMTVACTVAISLLGTPFVVAGWLLARRALPTRRTVAALLAAIASAIAAEAAWRLHCPFTSPVHFLTAHVPPYAFLAVIVWIGFRRTLRRA